MGLTKALVLSLAAIAVTVSGCTKPDSRPRADLWKDMHPSAPKDTSPDAGNDTPKDTPAKSEVLSPPDQVQDAKLGKKNTTPIFTDAPMPMPPGTARNNPPASADPKAGSSGAPAPAASPVSAAPPVSAQPAPAPAPAPAAPVAPSGPLTSGGVGITSTEAKPTSPQVADPVALPESAETESLASKAQLAAAKFENDFQKEAFGRYITGKEFCAKFASYTSKENGQFVKVPVDYADPKKGSTEIYAFFAEGNYDEKLPTVVMIDGGPGGNSHGAKRITKGYNELHFDQRGIGCSHPSSLELYRNPSFYGSEINARDIEEIRKALKIDKISVYGVSYGTLPATIYGNLFSDHATSVVLEGVMFSGAKTDIFNVLSFNIKKMYAELPEPTKQAMRAYFSTAEKAPGLYKLARLLMYRNNSFDGLKQILAAIFVKPDQINMEAADQLFNPKLLQNAFFDNDRVDAVEIADYLMVSCKEFPQGNFKEIVYQVSDTLGVKKELVPEDVEASKDTTCQALGFTAGGKPYQADQYPINVTTSYFQGSWDGATAAAGAMQHYKKVPKAKKQLFVAVKGGHTPMYETLLNDAGSALRESAVPVFEKALKGELASEADVKAMNDAQASHALKISWKYTSK